MRCSQPLLPQAKQLDGLPDKVTTLQAAAFEGSNQIAALNLAVSRLEKAQRGDKEPSEVDAPGGGGGGHCPVPRETTPSTPEPG